MQAYHDQLVNGMLMRVSERTPWTIDSMLLCCHWTYHCSRDNMEPPIHAHRLDFCKKPAYDRTNVTAVARALLFV